MPNSWVLVRFFRRIRRQQDPKFSGTHPPARKGKVTASGKTVQPEGQYGYNQKSTVGSNDLDAAAVSAQGYREVFATSPNVRYSTHAVRGVFNVSEKRWPDDWSPRGVGGAYCPWLRGWELRVSLSPVRRAPPAGGSGASPAGGRVQEVVEAGIMRAQSKGAAHGPGQTNEGPRRKKKGKTAGSSAAQSQRVISRRRQRRPGRPSPAGSG